MGFWLKRRLRNLYELKNLNRSSFFNIFHSFRNKKKVFASKNIFILFCKIRRVENEIKKHLKETCSGVFTEVFSKLLFKKKRGFLSAVYFPRLPPDFPHTEKFLNPVFFSPGFFLIKLTRKDKLIGKLRVISPGDPFLPFSGLHAAANFGYTLKT